MHRAIPAVLITAAVFVVVWRFEPTPATVTTAPPAVSTGSGDRAVLGSAEPTRFGTVQVQAVFSNGRLTDIQVVQSPPDRQTQRALPRLRAEALRAQSADVDTISGATATSEAYSRSLQAAIDQKGN
jgi:uncharacterized protein with FMN-binding domain